MEDSRYPLLIVDMKKKNLIIAGLCTLGAVGIAAGIVTGVNAFYVETADASHSAVAGSVSIVNDTISVSNIGNFNPGDENPEKDLPAGHRPGSEHKLTYKIHNEGSKSITTRSIIDLTVVGTDGNILDPSVFTLYQTSNGATTPVKLENATDSNIKEGTILGERMYVLNDNSVVAEKPADISQIKSLRYIVLGPNLNGVGEAAEVEKLSAGPESTVSYAVALDFTAPDTYQGADVSFDVEVQCMQYRNTNLGDWETIYSDHITAQK